MKSAWIRRIELTIVRRIALGDVDDQSALGPGLADQFHHAFEHAGLGEVLSEFLVPGPVTRNEISLKVDQKDGSLSALMLFAAGATGSACAGATRASIAMTD